MGKENAPSSDHEAEVRGRRPAIRSAVGVIGVGAGPQFGPQTVRRHSHLSAPEVAGRNVVAGPQAGSIMGGPRRGRFDASEGANLACP